MAFIPTIGAIELVVHFTVGGLPCSITLTLGTGGVPPTATQLEDAALATNGWATGTLGDWLSNQLEFTGVTAYDLTSASSPTFTVVNAPTIPGAVADPMISGNTSIVASLRTANRGRSSRGRNYVTGVPNASKLDPFHSTTTFAANLLGAYLTGLAAFATAGFTWMVNSKYTLGVPRTAGFLQQVNAIVVDNEIDSKDRSPI